LITQQTNFEQKKDTESNRKNNAVDFMNLLIPQKFMDGLRFFSPECKTHNPYVAGTIRDLLNAMVAANKEMAPSCPTSNLARSMFLPTETSSQSTRSY
jgi:hypothetical protein